MVVPLNVMMAALQGNFAVVEAYFASAPRDMEDHVESGGGGMTMPVPLLHIALDFQIAPVDDADGRYRISEMLLARGADPNGRSGWGYVPLSYPLNRCENHGTPRLVKLLLLYWADAKAMGCELQVQAFSQSCTGCLLRSPSDALTSGFASDPDRPFKNHLGCLKLLLRAGASLDNCITGANGPTVVDAEYCLRKQEGRYASLTAEADWIAIKDFVHGVRAAGSWKAWCRVPLKEFMHLRSHFHRGRATATDALVERILHLPNGPCWKVLAFWREAA